MNLELNVAVDTVWVLVCSFLVFFMNAGFGFVEAGFCRAKNATNILAKNFIVFGIASLAFWAIGFGLMFADGTPYFGWGGWFATGPDNSPAVGEAYQGIFSSLSWAGVPFSAKFFFQLAFAGTAATIVSGCVAERIHYSAFIIFSLIIAGVIYPIVGHWIWGGGWLSKLGMFDFAGSTVVHSVGGWAGLAGILFLGPRIGKYPREGGVAPIPGHNMSLAFLGAMILWLGWFGFNPGSTMGVAGDGGLAAAHIVVTTNLACAAGVLTATILILLLTKKPDFSMTVNGALAGLVSVTASCAYVSPSAAVIIGAIGGLLVVAAVIFFDRIRIDDPVGALSVHLICGMWGTLAVGIWANSSEPGKIATSGLLHGGGLSLLLNQCLGIVTVGLFTFFSSAVLWYAIKRIVGLRVSPHVEVEGLDIHEMGMEAYPHERLGDVHTLLKKSRLGRHTTSLVKEARKTSRRSAPNVPPDAPVFFLELVGISPEDFLEYWSTWCGSGRGSAAPEFQDVYRHFTTMNRSVLRFKGGNEIEIREKLQQLVASIDLAAKVIPVDAAQVKQYAN